MPVESPLARRTPRRFIPARFVVRVGSEWCPVRAATIQPIADVLAATACLEPAKGVGAADPGLILDLLDSAMTTPPASRRRRDRAVSSRAVFYQAADA